MKITKTAKLKITSHSKIFDNTIESLADYKEQPRI